MEYKCYKPAPPLQPFIDLYWHLSGRIADKELITLLPDGGISLLVNLGENFTSSRFDLSFKYGVYMIGPMMKADVQVLQGEVLLFGINFKPGAFTHFYKYESLDRITDQVLDFKWADFPDVKKSIQHFVPYLDQFYLDRLSPAKVSILKIVSDISHHAGVLTIDSLAKRHFTTQRRLERLFKQHVGLSPKEFLNLERFKKALAKVENRESESLFDIAWNSGYYDHAHMTNDFKRYTGKSPTDFILSDFSKTISTEPM